MLHFPDTRLAQYSFFNAFDCTGSACSIESPSGDGVILTRTFNCGNVLTLCRHQTYPVTNSKGTNVTYSCIADIPTAGPRSNVRQQCQNWHGGQGRSRNIVERRQELDEVA
ncbi:unnamed protein product [Peronospora belbahrii]|uniref:Sushi domain-containing protein n=1 Tax=Peronospora belbahrii TaxID=622444 RepID=A0AAU9KXC7_9STRA|nr:unnamed protein product [Peronospora belbahrii]CAH0514287.1 unnamed protein product [Peronospora belbahrii]